MSGCATRILALTLAAVLAAMLAAPATTSRAAQIEGVTFPDRLEVRDTSFVLNGVALLWYRWVFKGYVAALYLGEGVKPAQLLDDVPRRLEIEYFWDIGAEGFRQTTIDGIRKNRGEEAAARLADKIARFNRFYRDVEAGDRYALTYLPGRGLELALNGQVLGRVEGAEFGAAVFSIWFGDKPFDAGLKAKLLGAS